MNHIRVLLFLCFSLTLGAQTRVDLAAQTKNADLSGASFTKPFKIATTLPGTCLDGEAIVKMPEAHAYVCHPANSWVSLTGPGGSQTGTPGDFAVTTAGGSATMGANCAPATPCNAAFGAQVFSFPNAATASALIGMANASTVYFYISSAGVRSLGVPANAGATVSNMTLATGVTAFPNDSLPVASCTVVNNQFTNCTDHRAFLRGLNVAGTNGIGVTRNANGVVLDFAGTAGVENPTFGPVMNGAAAAPGNLNVPGAYLAASGETAVVRFPASESVQVTFSQALSEEWTGPVDAEVWWTLAGGTGNVQWKATTACVTAGGPLSYTWNGYVAGAAQAGQAGTVRKTAFAGATALPVNGCAAGSLMRVGIARDNTVSGNAAGDAQLFSIRLKIRKAS